ncbi:MAG: cytochrome P450 [Actinomycetia bacterium]|nr:cytochrome P450 [Actinomycetes bacterium]
MAQRTPSIEGVTVADLDRDPYPLYARMRATQPVAWVPAVNLWMVTRWDDVHRVTTDEETFTAVVESSPVDRCFGQPTIITTDGQVHRELRKATDPKYRPARVNEYIDDLVRPIANAALDEIVAAGSADLLTEYFEPISALSLARSMGFADVDVPTLRGWFRGLSLGATNFELDPTKQAAGDATANEIRGLSRDLFARFTAQPDECALAQMLHAGMPDGSTRAPDFLMPTVLVTLLGGMQEPGHGAGSVLAGLLTHAEQWAAVRADNQLVMKAVDEGLRWIAPIGTQTRQATVDVEVSGAVIPRGDAVAAVVGSACRDETKFSNPDEFNLFRTENETAAFGFGSHYCTGHWFARHQIRIAFEVLLERIPQVRFPDGFVPEFVGWEFRAPTTLPAVW